MKKHVLVDIGIITEYLRTGQGVLPKAYEKYNMQICAITYSELLASKTFSDSDLEKEVLDFVKKYFSVQEIDEAISLEAGRILREEGTNLATAIIAATSKAKGLDLITDNEKEYEKIDGVNILDLN